MKKKEWTILAYLNGNNELAPEMNKTKQDITNASVQTENNILIQIGRASQELVKIIRPQENLEFYDDYCSGVRRYIIEGKKSILKEELGNINMADYKNFYRFVEWGVKNYPAKRYSIIIAGHGFLVLTLSDFVGKKPYTMGVYELCTAINNLKSQLNIDIDILIFDICYMNSIEVIYELSKNKYNTVKYFMTFIEEGPLDGLPYNEILNVFNEEDTKVILKRIINRVDMNLVVTEINHNKVNKIKYYSNKAGYEKLLMKKGMGDEKIYTNYLAVLYKEILKLVIFEKNNKNTFPINMIKENSYGIENTNEFIKFYFKLSFTKNNYWANVVAKKSIDDSLNMDKVILRNEELTVDNIYVFIKIFNQNLNDKEIGEIIRKLYRYKGWEIIGK